MTALAIVGALALSGCAPTPSAGIPTPSPTAVNPFAAGGLQDPAESSPPVPAGIPVHITIPAIGVSSALEDLDVGADGRLAAPIDYDRAGWYRAGVRPGDVGPAIIAGHVDSPTAPAVFARIAELAPGAEVLIDAADGTRVRFLVSGSVQSAKSAFPTAEVYSNVPSPELRLITCAGPFDPAVGHYTDNLVVFAVRTD